MQRNQGVVHVDKKSEFLAICLSLLSNHITLAQFDEIVAKIKEDYPNAKKWIEWWIRDEISIMIFPTKQIDKTKSFFETLPETTNAQESIHRLYYQVTEANNGLNIGFIFLLLFIEMLSAMFDEIKTGGTIRYGKSEKWKIVAEKYGVSKKSRIDKKTLNDGRPPDTSTKLLKKPLKPGRKKGGVNTQKNQDYTFLLFTWRDNLCYADHLVASLLACFYQLKKQKISFECLNLLNSSEGLKDLFNGFEGLLTSKQPKAHREKMQTKYCDFYTKEKVDNEIKIAPYKQLGELSEPIEFYDFLISNVVDDMNFAGALKNELTSLFFFEGVSRNSASRLRSGRSSDSRVLWKTVWLNKLIYEYALKHLKKENYDGNIQSILNLLLNENVSEDDKYEDNQFAAFTVFPKILVFNVSLMVSEEEECSHKFYFPETLKLNQQTFTIVARVNSTHISGVHFNARIKLENPIHGEYFYDDINTNGYAVLQSGESKIVGRHKLTAMVFYVENQNDLEV